MTNSLPQNYKLNTRYTILHQIGQGGFGITYKAYDSVFDRDVCIKELFIDGNSRREESFSITSQAIGSIDFSYFKNKFLEEAKKLAKFDHPNIVKVLEYFEANNTAYMVMDFVEGKNLKAYVQEKGKLDEETALGIFNQLLQATEVIHAKNYLHRDIKPDNIIITPENKAVLIDFGTAKFHEDDNGDTSTLVLLSHGYAPPEQYSNEHKKDKYTDIYALGATLYFMLTGVKPIQATDRTINELRKISAFTPSINVSIEKSVIKAMQLNPSKRFQKVAELRYELKFNQTYPIEHKQDELEREKKRKEKFENVGLNFSIGLGLITGLIVLIYTAMEGGLYGFYLGALFGIIIGIVVFFVVIIPIMALAGLLYRLSRWR